MHTKRNPHIRYSMSLIGLASGIALAATVAAAPAALAAEAYPAGKPITLVVPYPPGGSNDVFARAVGADRKSVG